jgi:hypothetical protein
MGMVIMKVTVKGSRPTHLALLIPTGGKKKIMNNP